MMSNEKQSNEKQSKQDATPTVPAAQQGGEVQAAGPRQDHLPPHLRGIEPKGLEVAAENRSVQRLRIVQSSGEAKMQHDVGSVILTPSGEQVAAALSGTRGLDGEAMSESFIAIPVFQFESFEQHSDYNDDSLDMVQDIAYSRDTEIARRAMNKALRSEPYGDKGQYTMQWVHCLNLILLIDSGPLAGELAVWTYNKGDFQFGKNLNSLLMRRGTNLWYNRVQHWGVGRQNDKNAWIALAYANPGGQDLSAPENYVAADRMAELDALHAEVARQFDTGVMRMTEPDAEVKQTAE